MREQKMRDVQIVMIVSMQRRENSGSYVRVGEVGTKSGERESVNELQRQ